MKNLVFGGLLILSFFPIKSWGQISNCGQTLRLARATYEQGRLHELPTLINDCLNGVGSNTFSKEEKVEAYRLLTQSYIYLEEPEKADEAMLGLLKTDHFYKPNPAVEPAEFIALYNKFRTKPLFSVGLVLGGNVTFPTVTGNYYIGVNGVGNGVYTPGLGFQVGLVFERDIFQFKKGFLNNLTLAPELMLIQRSFTYTNDNYFISDITGESIGTQEAIARGTWFDFNALVQYRIPTNKGLQIYVGAGPGISYLFNNTSQLNLRINPATGTSQSVSGPDVEFTDAFNKVVYSATFNAGGKFRIGSIYVKADVRYQLGFVNLIEAGNRSNSEAVFDYGFQNNDFKQSGLLLNIGFTYPYFRPKKLIR